MPSKASDNMKGIDEGHTMSSKPNDNMKGTEMQEQAISSLLWNPARREYFIIT